MSKQTRDERLAAGWVECWGVYHDVVGWYGDRKLWAKDPRRYFAWSKTPVRREAFPTIAAAKKLTMCHETEASGVRRFWRRRKPKAPPPLKVGDAVLLRGTVINAHYDTPLPQVGVEIIGVMGVKSVFVDVDKVVRAAKE